MPTLWHSSCFYKEVAMDSGITILYGYCAFVLCLFLFLALMELYEAGCLDGLIKGVKGLVKFMTMLILSLFLVLFSVFRDSGPKQLGKRLRFFWT